MTSARDDFCCYVGCLIALICSTVFQFVPWISLDHIWISLDRLWNFFFLRRRDTEPLARRVISLVVFVLHLIVFLLWQLVVLLS